MAYAGTSSVIDFAKGYQVAEDIKQAPSATEAAIEKNKYESQRYKGLQDYMKSEKDSQTKPDTSSLQKGVAGTSPEIDPAITAGGNAYSVINLGQELQQRKQEIKAEENRMKNLSPEDKAHAGANLEHLQKDADNLEAKLLKESEQHLGEQYSLIDSVKDEASLQGARAYARRGINALADKAIADKKIDPSNKEAFITAELNSMLPEHYDSSGKSMLDTRKNGMLSIGDQIKFKMAEAANKRALAELQKADAASQRYMLMSERQLASGDAKVLSEERQNITNQQAANNKMIADYTRQMEDETKAMSTTPSTVSTGFLGLSSAPNPDKAAAKDRVDSLRAAIKQLSDSNSKLTLQREVLMAKIGVKDPSGKTTKEEKPTAPAAEGTVDNPIVLD